MQLSYIQRTFHFNFAAYTSRGTLLERTCWFLILQDNEKLYIGECAPIPGLSPEPLELIPDELDAICRFFNAHHHFPPINTHIFPSIAFAVESISKQISNLQSSLLYPSSFTTGTDGISINGLIWAGSREKVLKQIDEKIDARFPCIKIKIGALPFEEEIEILKNVRQLYPQIEIRLDANGAFAPDEALDKLEQLAFFQIHSIEQPISPNHWQEMSQLCKYSPIPIALDEELITLDSLENKKRMLDVVQPRYIILKPTLVGGFAKAEEWIGLAEERHIGWWITSALETNIGLNAIAQWTYSIAPNKIHGLGTGLIYRDNIPSPLILKEGKLYHSLDKGWDFSGITQNAD